MAPYTEYLKRSHSRGIAIFSYPLIYHAVGMPTQSGILVQPLLTSQSADRAKRWITFSQRISSVLQEFRKRRHCQVTRCHDNKTAHECAKCKKWCVIHVERQLKLFASCPKKTRTIAVSSEIYSCAASQSCFSHY